jgi:hypothetical protein
MYSLRAANIESSFESSSWSRLAWGGAALLLALGAGVWSSARSSPTETLIDPEQLVGEAIDNEIHGQIYNHTHWCYRKTVRADGRSELRGVCQTASGDIDRLLAVNQRALSPELQRKEDERLQKLVADSNELRKEQEKRSEDAAKGRKMLRSLHRAFRYEYLGREGDVVALKFIPNPSFEPSNRPEEILRHIEGTIWIDCQEKQLVRIEGQVVSDVKFTGGLLGRLQSGGTFSFREGEVDPGQWEMITLNIHMRGKALLFKTIAVQEDREFSDYRRIDAETTPEQAAELLQRDATAFVENVTESQTTQLSMPVIRRWDIRTASSDR